MSIVPPPTVTPADLGFIRSHTNGATDWTDDALTILAQQWTTSQEAIDEGVEAHGRREEPEETPDVETAEAVVGLDLWAACAMICEYRLQKAVDDQTTGAVQVRSGDAHLQFGSTGGGTWILRVYIKRYWRLADPVNREAMHPSGWRSLSVHTAKRMQLRSAPFGSFVINGPNAGLDALQGR